MDNKEYNCINMIRAFGATPSKQQLEYQKEELSAFIHFGINTFMDREWGTGYENPKVFNPTNLNTDQWIEILKEAGFKRVILTAKHHDGFCLWNSKYTNHNISKSQWKNGNGDIVDEMSKSCKKYGVKFAIYLSPWDENSEYYGMGKVYNDYYINQLKELLINYGEISEVWMDGAKGSNVQQDYNFEEWFKLIKTYHKNCIIFSPHGPDIRWIGNEQGYAGEPCWSTINLERMKVSVSQEYLNTGEEKGKDWVIGECDVSIRPGWFYHKDQDLEVKSLEKLLDIYFNSVGRNSVLLLNVPPNKEGLIHDNDVERIKEFGQAINSIFKKNLILNSEVTSSSILNDSRNFDCINVIDENYETYWAPKEYDENPYIEIDFKNKIEFDVICIQEFISLGQRVAEFNVEALINNQLVKIFEGKTIGYKRLLRLNTIYADKIRINFTRNLDIPVINNVAVYKQPKELEAKKIWSLEQCEKSIIKFEKGIYEIKENLKEVKLKVIRNGELNKKVEIDYSTFSGTAINGVNYQPWSGTLVFNEGEVEKIIRISIIDTKMINEIKYFYVRLEDTLDLVVLNKNKEAIVNITSN